MERDSNFFEKRYYERYEGITEHEDRLEIESDRVWEMTRSDLEEIEKNSIPFYLPIPIPLDFFNSNRVTSSLQELFKEKILKELKSV